MSDLRFAFRQLVKSPGFTAIAVLSLAIGIGASTALFSMLNGVLLRALPVHAPHELRVLNWVGVKPRLNNYTGIDPIVSRGNFRVGSSFPYPVFRELAAGEGGTATVFAFYPLARVTLSARGEAVASSGLMVSGNFFAGYGAATFIGRPLAADDDQPGAAPVAVITHGLWQRLFGGAYNAIGETLTVNQHAFTIVGVLPRDYVGPLPGDMAECYVTFAAQPALAASRPLDSINQWWVQLMARIAPGESEAQVRAACEIVFRRVLAASVTTMEQPGIRLEAGARGAARAMRAKMAMPLLALLAVVGLVMGIACANVAGLLLARGAARRHEFAVRAAMGANRWRLVRQTLAESLLLALAAAMVGLLFAEWGKGILLQSLGAQLEGFRINLSTDHLVLGFTLGISVLAAVAFGLVPALRASRVDPLEGLKSRTALVAPRLRLGKVLVAAQVALSVLLVVGAALMLRTFANLVRVHPGFNPDNVLLFRVAPSQVGVSGDALHRFYTDARRAVAALPGVRSVALTNLTLVAGDSSTNAIALIGRPAQPGDTRAASELYASDGYFRTMGMPIVLGREFAESDTPTSQPVAVVNETFARTFFPGEHPLGQTFTLTHDPERVFTIIGVSRDAKYASVRDPVPPVMCFSTGQRDLRAIQFVVRSNLPPLTLVPAVRKTIAKLNPNLPVSAIRTQAQVVEHSTSVDRLVAGLCSGLAGLALLLACIGLYGVMAYNVARRTGEIGVRMALGATRRAIAWPILREALGFAAIGLGLGIPAALGVARLIRHQLYGVSPADPVSLGVGALLLVVVVLLAAWLPARRAANVDPMAALRAE